MDFRKKTVRDIDVAGKVVLVRVDYNVPIKDGKITGLEDRVIRAYEEERRAKNAEEINAAS